MPIGPRLDEPNPLMTAIAKKLRDTGLVGPENPPVHGFMQGLDYMTDEETNPPVGKLLGLLRKADPMNTAGFANPMAMGVGMALWGRDANGRRFRIDPNTGKEILGMTDKEVADAKAIAEATSKAIRQKEFVNGPLRAVGFRNRKTGEVIEGSLTHPSSLHRIPESWHSDVEDGFITRDGRFVNRREATAITGIQYDPALGLESYLGASQGAYGEPIFGGGHLRDNPSQRLLAPELEADRKAWNDAIAILIQKSGLTRDQAVEKLGKAVRQKMLEGSKETVVDAGLKATSIPTEVPEPSELQKAIQNLQETLLRMGKKAPAKSATEPVVRDAAADLLGPDAVELPKIDYKDLRKQRGKK